VAGGRSPAAEAHFVRRTAAPGGTIRRYHHLGIPTTEPRPGERYLPHLKVHVCGYETSPYRIEWMRFDPDCDVPDLVRTVPHVAFEVDDLEAELVGKEVIIAPNSPSNGVRVAFIVDNGAPVEFLEIHPRATDA
jgi:hypothetical protein